MVCFASWQENGVIPNKDAPRTRKSTKAAKNERAKEALLAKRRMAHHVQDPNADVNDLMDEDGNLRTDNTKMSRNYRDYYNCILDHSAATRIYATRSITPNEIMRASRMHSRACQNWAKMNCHLTPNFHLAEHTPDFLLAYGPPYGYWGYPMEQHNGFLRQFTHNGRGGGELEATLMRGWLKYSLVSDLVR